MIIQRRTFLLGTGLIAALPALASVKPPLPATRKRSSLPSPADASPVTDRVFRIDGWSHPEDAQVEDTQGRDGGPVWISINQSWRTVWR